MTERATFTLDTEAHEFLVAMGGRNRSAFISTLLKAEKRRRLAKKILQANLEEADTAYQSELSVWDESLSDGLDR